MWNVPISNIPEGIDVSKLSFRPYASADREECLRLFDANCPEFFAPNEGSDYADFLATRSQTYRVCEREGHIIGAYGLNPAEPGTALNWILLSPASQGQGVGSMIMKRIIAEIRASGGSPLHISASHKSAPFFAKFGADEISRVRDGWGRGMHRVEMRIDLD
jgi:GNAT superfamily N-acetyltransferase